MCSVRRVKSRVQTSVEAKMKNKVGSIPAVHDRVKVFDRKATGCLLPFSSSWVRTAPYAYLEASHSIWKGLEESGMISTGSSVNFFLRSSKWLARSHLFVHWSCYVGVFSDKLSVKIPEP